MINPNPIVYEVNSNKNISELDDINFDDTNDNEYEPVNKQEIFDMLRHVNDPEHPLTLEQLNVTRIDDVIVDNEKNLIKILFTPTIPHCSMATLIGLSLRVKLLRSLPKRFKVDIQISPGTHMSENAINKQLNDKERVCAALENDHLLNVVNTCLKDSDKLPPNFDIEKFLV